MGVPVSAPAPVPQQPVLIEQLMEAVFIGRKIRPGDKAFMREVLRLKQRQDVLLEALQTAGRALGTMSVYKLCVKDGAGRDETNAAIKRAFEQCARAQVAIEVAVLAAREGT